MWLVPRHALGPSRLWTTFRPCAPHVSVRTYVSKNKGKQRELVPQADEPVTSKRSRSTSTANLIPTSQRALTDEVAQAEYDKASSKMSVAVDWFRKEVAGLVARGVGRVTPAILDPVRVAFPDTGTDLRLQDLATVGIREGTNLVVTLFEENNLKYVEKAIYAAKLHSIVPQKIDARTIKIAIPRPTMEARTALLNSAAQIAEDARVRIRKTRDTSVRKHKWKPRSDEIEQFQKLCDTQIKEVEQIFIQAKKELGS